MKLTSGKLRYLLTIAALERASELKISSRVRCIDIAVQLGISRASVCKMLSSLCKEGLIEQAPDKSLHITPFGHELAQQYEQQYHQLCPVFQNLGLSEFDAQECAMALLSQLQEQTLKNVCSCLSSENLAQLFNHFSQMSA